MGKGPTIKLYNSDGVSVGGVVDCMITDYSTTHEEWVQDVSMAGSAMTNPMSIEETMNWNPKRPTEPGMYLFRRKNTNEVPVCCILKDCMLSMYHLGDNKLHITDIVNCEWYGPIEGVE